MLIIYPIWRPKLRRKSQNRVGLFPANISEIRKDSEEVKFVVMLLNALCVKPLKKASLPEGRKLRSKFQVRL